MNNTRNNVLRVRSSGRRSGSTTRSLGDALIKNLATENGIELTERELADGVPFVDEAWINANFTDPFGTPRPAPTITSVTPAFPVPDQMDVLSLEIPTPLQQGCTEGRLPYRQNCKSG